MHLREGEIPGGLTTSMIVGTICRLSEEFVKWGQVTEEMFDAAGLPKREEHIDRERAGTG